MLSSNDYQKALHRFIGTEAYHQSTMSDTVLTDGALWASQNGLEQVVNTIVSRQVEVCTANKTMKKFQVWTLKKVPHVNKFIPHEHPFQWELTGGTGAKGKKPLSTTNFMLLAEFPLDSIQFYVEPASDGRHVVMLTSEH